MWIDILLYQAPVFNDGGGDDDDYGGDDYDEGGDYDSEMEHYKLIVGHKVSRFRNFEFKDQLLSFQSFRTIYVGKLLQCPTDGQ